MAPMALRTLYRSARNLLVWRSKRRQQPFVHRRHRLAFRPELEALEERVVMSRVLLLADIDAPSTGALVSVLQNAGNTVTQFTPEYNWTDTPSLVDVDVVVHLDGATPYNTLPLESQ